MSWLLVGPKAVTQPEGKHYLGLNNLELDQKANLVGGNSDRWAVLYWPGSCCSPQCLRVKRAFAFLLWEEKPGAQEGAKSYMQPVIYVHLCQWDVARSDNSIKSTEEASPRSACTSAASTRPHFQTMRSKLLGRKKDKPWILPPGGSFTSMGLDTPFSSCHFASDTTSHYFSCMNAC